MQIHTQVVNSVQNKMVRLSMFPGIWAGLQKLASGKRSSPSTQLFCEKWRPAGIGVLLTDKDKWLGMGCQG